jgi:hypothetical protein
VLRLLCVNLETNLDHICGKIEGGDGDVWNDLGANLHTNTLHGLHDGLYRMGDGFPNLPEDLKQI